MQYAICGILGKGAPECEDFLAQDGGRNVTMTADPSIAAGQFLKEYDEGDGWIDVRIPEMTEEVAKQVLATLNNVDPEKITIIQRGLI